MRSVRPLLLLLFPVSQERDAFYDPLGAVKGYVNKTKPYFGYFAESFLAPPGVMAYGDEVEHLEASFADSTLGDLQSTVVGEETFMAEFDRYLQIANNSSVSPCFTMMTGDKDDGCDRCVCTVSHPITF